mgnify:CR=1 FL=1
MGRARAFHERTEGASRARSTGSPRPICHLLLRSLLRRLHERDQRVLLLGHNSFVAHELVKPRAATVGDEEDNHVGGVAFAADLASWHLGIVRTTMANATLFGNAASFVLMGLVLMFYRES